MNAITLHYSEDLIRKAVKAFWLRVMGWRYVVALVLVLGPLVSLIARGDRSWLVGLLGMTSGLAILFGVALYVVHLRESLRRFRRMRNPEGTFEPGEERFRVSSDAGLSELAWSSIQNVWRFPEFWLLFLSPARFLTFPTADLDEASRELILAKVQSHGGKTS